MNDMIDKVALAIWQEREKCFPARVQRMKPDDWDRANGAWEFVRNEARAAIEAMPSAADALRYKSMFDDAVAQHDAQMERAEKAEGFLKAAEEHIARLQTALAFWLPGVNEAIEKETGGLAGDHAMLLVGFEGPVPDISWGDQMISRLKQAEADRDEARQIVRDIHWMARRYASGRHTYAPSMFNEAISKAVAGGWLTADNVSEPLLAVDPADEPATITSGGDHEI